MTAQRTSPTVDPGRQHQAVVNAEMGESTPNWLYHPCRKVVGISVAVLLPEDPEAEYGPPPPPWRHFYKGAYVAPAGTEFRG